MIKKGVMRWNLACIAFLLVAWLFHEGLDFAPRPTLSLRLSGRFLLRDVLNPVPAKATEGTTPATAHQTEDQGALPPQVVRSLLERHDHPARCSMDSCR